MLRRDRIILQKVIAEIDIGLSMLGSSSMEAFLSSDVPRECMAGA